MFEILIGLGKAGASICVMYCFFDWLDPVAKYVENESKYVRWLAMSLFFLGMIFIAGSIMESVDFDNGARSY